jgi:DNA modification methylase
MATDLRNRVTGMRYLHAADLLPNPKNFRTHPDYQRAALTDLLAEVGIANALIAYQTPAGLQLIDGHLRKDAAPDTLWPVLVLDVDEAEATTLLATLDPIGALAQTNRDRLSAILSEVKTGSDAVRDVLGGLADAAGIARDAGAPLEDVEPQIDRAEELRVQYGVELGQLWQLGTHRLLCGDSTDAACVARVLAGGKPVLLVTSPPYNQGIDTFKPSGMHKEGDWVAKVGRLAYADSIPESEYQAQQRVLLELWHAVLADGASVFYNHKNRYRDKQVISPLVWLPGPFRLRQEIVWSRPGSVTQNARMFLPSDERIYWLYKGADFYFDDTTEHKTWSTVWEIPLETNKDHAVGFPVLLPIRAISACSRAGDIVAEPYCGSGTTIIACEQIGRQCRAIELDPGYVAVALERFRMATGQTAVRIE